jgi:MFS family permease
MSASATGGLVALRSRDFRLLLLGQLVSLTGSQMQQVAVAWQLYLLSNKSSLALGTLGLARVIPILVFALGGGVVADAFDRRKLMLITQTILALTSLGLAVATYLGVISLPWIYGLAFFASIGIAFDNPARQALVPQLVTAEELPNALSLNATMRQFATVGGPALGGAALNWLGPAPIYVIDAASFLAVILALVLMEHRAPPMAKTEVSVAAALEGLRFMRSSPIILSTTLLDFVATFFGGSMLLMPIFADQLLHVGPNGLGLLYAAQPIGAVIAGASLSTMPSIQRQGPAVLISVALYGVAITAFGASPWFWFSFLMLAISGAADTVSMVVRQTLRQLLTPDALRGRMTGLNMIFFIGGPQLGEFEAGAVANAFTPRFSVASGGILCTVAAVMIAFAVPNLRRYHARTLPLPA